MAWNDGLQGQALQIAATTNSPLCVVAGPGTGKSFALMRRLSRLLEIDRANPQRILACTFTRTAAEDFTRSLAELGVEGADLIRTQTIHGFCFSMLTAEEVLEATTRVPRPLLHFEERFLLQDIHKASQRGVRECGKKLLAFSAAWARLQHEQAGWPHDADDQSFQSDLLSWLMFHEGMLIGELIPEGIKYLRNNPQSTYRAMFDHLLVDEYQDLNKAEQQLIDLLVTGTLVVVGDEDQSIYSFKHAHPEGIVEFPVTHPGTQALGLDSCRRCPRTVVAMANSLISHNATRSQRLLHPMSANPVGEVHVVQWTSMEEEALGVARFIKSRTDAGVIAPGKILVLAPRRDFGYLVRDELVALGVPAHSFFSEEMLDGDPKKLDASNAQQAIALLALLANPDDRVALRCWCGFGHSSLADSAWMRLRSHCETTGMTPFEALEELESGELTLPHTGHIVARFRELQLAFQRLDGATGSVLVDGVFPAAEAWTGPFREIAASLEGEDADADRLGEALRRSISQPEIPTRVEFVRVMSLHKSKGLTAELVVAMGCLQGLTPYLDESLTPHDRRRALEEQRRLFYVAITRAQQTLVLSSVTSLPVATAFKMGAQTTRTVYGRALTIASQFIHELGPTCPAAVTGAQFLETAMVQV